MAGEEEGSENSNGALVMRKASVQLTGQGGVGGGDAGPHVSSCYKSQKLETSCSCTCMPSKLKIPLLSVLQRTVDFVAKMRKRTKVSVLHIEDCQFVCRL